MTKNEFKIAINNVIKNIPDIFFNQIEIYKTFLQEKNKQFNLTNLANDADIYAKYFYESIIPYVNIDFSNIKKVLDIGSGSGIPGILIKILNPNLQLDIIEATNKKANFIVELSKKLNLDNVNVFNKRAENIEISQREQYDLVTSRAVAPLKIILEVSTPYCKVDGLIVEPKSSNNVKEQKEAGTIIKSLNLIKKEENNFTSINGFNHCVLIYQKKAKTNIKYPRTWKEIIK